MPNQIRQLRDTLEMSSDMRAGSRRRAVDRFLGWLENRAEGSVDRHLFLAYGAARGTRAALSDLEKALMGCLPAHHSCLSELRAAVLDHRRRVDGKTMVVDIVSASWWRPFAANCDLDRLTILEVRRLDSWLSWMHDNDRTTPTADDFLKFGADFDSAAPLVSLHAALSKLELPAIPALALELPKAIAKKRAITRGQEPPRRRTHWPRKYSVAREELPADWRETLDLMHSSQDVMSDAAGPSKNTVQSHERRLRELAWSCRASGVPVALDARALSLHAKLLRGRQCRATSCEINASFLVRFAEYHGVDQREIEEMKVIVRRLKDSASDEVPQKFERLRKVGSTQTVLGTATKLLRKAEQQQSLKHRVSHLNGASALALFSLVPLRVIDSNLQWGKHVSFDGVRYRMHVGTSKNGNLFVGPLVEFLTPFLDALLLRGCDPCFLDDIRRQAEAKQLHLFAHSDAGHLSDRCVANLWARHVGCKPHIARTMVHTELGQMGAQGVAQALALCAQRSPQTAAFYQGKAMRDALLLESNELLLKGFSEEEVEAIFKLDSD